MPANEMISILQVLLGAAVMLVSIIRSLRIKAMVPQELRGKWLAVISLMVCFLIGYLLFIVNLLIGRKIPLELITGTIFMGGALFVYGVILISRITLEDIIEKNTSLQKEICERQHLEQELADIAAAKVLRSEQALRESEERMGVILDSIEAGVVLIDCETRRVADVNPAAVRMRGSTREEIVGLACRELFYHGEENGCSILDHGLRGKTSERWLVRRSGEQLPILKSVNRVTVKGRPYILETFVDLSEQRTLEAELVVAKEAAEAACGAKSIFLASMSHEIRTPMNAILGYSQLLRREKGLQPRQAEYLDIINRSGEHLLKLINDILELSKIEAGRIQITSADFNLHHLLNDVGTLFENRAQEKGVAFHVKMDGNVPAGICSDGEKVRQILINLIGNAMKFTDQGHVGVHVSLASPAHLSGGASERGVVLALDVDDTGSGIAAEDFERIFALFEQTGSGTGRADSSGLGMSISRRLARALGGDLILLRSAMGEGSVFRFTFPAVVSDLQKTLPLPISKRYVQEIASGEKQWRVLVVDDRLTNRKFLSEALLRAGFVVSEAEDGREGLSRCREWRPDIVLLDIMMPKMDGYEVVRRIRELDLGGTLPVVIAITANVMAEEREKVLSRGFDGFIMKPVNMEELYEEIGRHTGIVYRYDDDLKGGIAASRPAVALAPAQLGSLPEELVAAMRKAVETGDMIALRKLTEQVSVQDAALAAVLRRLVDAYAYDELTTLFAKEEQDAPAN